MRDSAFIMQCQLPKDKYNLPTFFIPRIEDGYYEFFEYEVFFQFLQTLTRNFYSVLLETRSKFLHRSSSIAGSFDCRVFQLFCWGSSRNPTLTFVISFGNNADLNLIIHKGKEYKSLDEFVNNNVPEEFIFHNIPAKSVPVTLPFNSKFDKDKLKKDSKVSSITTSPPRKLMPAGSRRRQSQLKEGVSEKKPMDKSNELQSASSSGCTIFKSSSKGDPSKYEAAESMTSFRTAGE